MPLLSLSPLNVLILSSVRKHLQKVVCFILFIYSQAFNNNVISNGKSYCCNDTFTDVRFTSLVAKFKKNTKIIFTLLESAFHWLFCLKFLFKLVTFSCKKTKTDVFF